MSELTAVLADGIISCSGRRRSFSSMPTAVLIFKGRGGAGGFSEEESKLLDKFCCRQSPLRHESRRPDLFPEKPSGLFSFPPLQLWWGSASWILEALSWQELSAFVTSHVWMPAAAKMEEQPSLPNVSIPCHDEQRDKKKRYTVRPKISSLDWLFLLLCANLFLLFQVYKVLVSVGQQEWFVFKRYTEFDKLYNAVSSRDLLNWFIWSFWLVPPSRLWCLSTVTETVPVDEPENPCKEDIWGQFWARWVALNPSNRCWQSTLVWPCVFNPTEFLKQRRAGLHEFIKKIVSHPQLCNQ